MEEASAHGTVVVVNSAVIAYLAPDDRLLYDDLVRSLVAAVSCHWVSNESPGVLPSITTTGPEVPNDARSFVLGLDGQMVGRTHGHVAALLWTG